MNLRKQYAPTDIVAIISPAALLGLVLAPFVDSGLTGEEDMTRVAFALSYAILTGEGFEGLQPYGFWFSFGYYYLISIIGKTFSVDSPAEVIGLINWFGFSCAVLSVLVITVYLRMIFSARVAWAAGFVFAFSPMMLYLGTYGHPVQSAILLGCAGSVLLLRGQDCDLSGVHRLFMFLGAILTLTGALSMRMEIVLAFPFFTLADRPAHSFPTRDWLRRVVVRCACLVFVLLLFFGIKGLVLSDDYVFLERSENFVSAFIDFGSMPKGLAVLLIGAGLGLFFTISIGAMFWLRKGFNPRSALLVFSLILPGLAFWLPNPTPARHFALTIVGLSILFAVIVDSFFRSRVALTAAVLAVVAGNQVGAAVAYDSIVSAYRWSQPQIGDRRYIYTVPLGLAWENRVANDAQFRFAREEGRLVAKTCQAKCLFVGRSTDWARIALLERDVGARFSAFNLGGIELSRIQGRGFEVDFIEIGGGSPDHNVEQVLNLPEFFGVPIYLQQRTRLREDILELEPGRMLDPAEFAALEARYGLKRQPVSGQ